MKRAFLKLLLLSTTWVSAQAYAQFRVEISGVGVSQLPVAVVGFKGQDQSPQKISDIIQADLERSGHIRAIETQGTILDETVRPDFSFWKQKNSDALVTGSVVKMADGRYDVRYRLWDTVKGQDLGGKRLIVVPADLRLAAHQAADFIYEKLTGEKGVFATRISYVTKSGPRYTLWVADSDGQAAASALSSSEPIISPSWSPRGNQLAYVSFESRKPVVFSHQVQSGQRTALANFRGSNSSPSWSPDGNSLVMTLSRDGGSQLFTIDAAGGEPRRLSQSNAIDTEAVYAADGRSVYFVSDRGGAPQIYRMSVGGGAAERVTFTGGYNISPAPSPDGKYLAYISRVGGGAFRLHVLDLGTGSAIAITDTWSDERPTFAPNGKLILYATKVDGRDVLMTTTVDGKVKAKLNSPGGDIREPAWGPLVR